MISESLDAQGQFVATGLVHPARDAKELGAGGLRRQRQILEPLGPVFNDMGDAGQGLHVIHQGGFSPQPLVGGIGRRLFGVGSPALQGIELGGHLAADVPAAAAMDDDLEIVVAVKDTFSQQSLPAGDFDFPLQNSRGTLIFGTDKDDAVGRPNGIGRQGHALDKHVRFGMQKHAILKSPRFHLIGVANHIARKGGVFGYGLHFYPGRKSGAAASQQKGIRQPGLDLLPVHFRQDLAQGVISTRLPVFRQGGDAVRFAVLEQNLGILTSHACSSRSLSISRSRDAMVKGPCTWRSTRMAGARSQ